MFEDDVTVPAGWYPDPMGLPQLRWWNNHAWTELTTEARPPLVMQTASRLAYADEELPTRRQQREQRERDEQYANLATDEDDARDAAAAYAPLTTTLREIDPAVSTEVSTPDENLDDNDDAVDVGDRDPNLVSSGSVTANTVDPNIVNPNIVDLDTVDDVIVAADSVEPPASLSRPAFIPAEESVLGSSDTAALRAETVPATDDSGDSEYVRSAFQPRSANSTVAGSTAQNLRSEPGPNPDSEPFRRGRLLTRLPIYTATVWIIALVPLLLLVLSLLLLLGFGSSLNMWVTPGIWIASYVCVVILAITDRAALGHAGYEHRASWLWALLSAPVYLVARSMSLAKVGSLGFAPMLVWTALGILQIGSVLVVPGLIISALPNIFTMQAEQSIASDASIIGAKISVNCAKSLPVIIGQSFTCVATSPTKDSFDVTVNLQRRNGWINWHVEDWGIYTLSR